MIMWAIWSLLIHNLPKTNDTKIYKHVIQLFILEWILPDTKHSRMIMKRNCTFFVQNEHSKWEVLALIDGHMASRCLGVSAIKVSPIFWFFFYGERKVDITCSDALHLQEINQQIINLMELVFGHKGIDHSMTFFSVSCWARVFFGSTRHPCF